MINIEQERLDTLRSNYNICRNVLNAKAVIQVVDNHLDKNVRGTTQYKNPIKNNLFCVFEMCFKIY